jgi:hypothetical protein
LLAVLVGVTSASGATGGGTGGAGIPTKAPHPKKSKQPKTHGEQGNPLAARGMFIWYLSLADGGNLKSIAATSRKYGLGTLLIKSGDGTSYWSQFTARMVSTLHAEHLHVCAWQFVYGNDPAGEARVAARAVKAGADCLLIDAEQAYEGRYVQAQTYIRDLRKLVGASYPLALNSFPYVFDHPAFPYSVFMAPGGAQYNVPQMYWVAIGTSVGSVYSETYAWNRPYGRRIFPLGDLSTDPSTSDILRFRQLSRVYGAPGVSWWEWHQSTPQGWRAMSRPVGALTGSDPTTSMPVLSNGTTGDIVVWAQEHLYRAGERVTIDGSFGPKTEAAVKRFQSGHRIAANGVIGTSTWTALLRYSPVAVNWTRSGAKIAGQAAGLTLPVPESAKLPAKRYEIPPNLGAGMPKR